MRTWKNLLLSNLRHCWPNVSRYRHKLFFCQFFKCSIISKWQYTFLFGKIKEHQVASLTRVMFISFLCKFLLPNYFGSRAKLDLCDCRDKWDVSLYIKQLVNSCLLPMDMYKGGSLPSGYCGLQCPHLSSSSSSKADFVFNLSSLLPFVLHTCHWCVLAYRWM